MANKLWCNIWTVLNTEISIPWGDAVKDSANAAKAVLDLAKALEENKTAKELAPLIANIDSLLDVLNSPMAKVIGSGLPFVPLATGILQFLVEKTRQEPSLEDAVLLVSQAAYLESARQCLRGYLLEHPEFKATIIQQKQKNASEAVAKQIQQVGKLLDSGEIPFDDPDARDTLICFHDSPLAKAFNPVLAARLQEAGLAETQAGRVTERISRNTHRYLKEAVAKVRDKVPTLAAIYGQGWLRDIETYGSIDKYLNDIIAQKPQETVFDENFTFRDVYVPLEVKPLRDGKVHRKTRPQNIETWAANLLAETDKNGHKQVLFIQGGPGRGKSVFCRMFADWVRRELHPIYTPILIRLRDVRAFELDFDKTLSAAVGWDFSASDSGWLTDRNTRFLFLLDGFDELLLERGSKDGVGQLLEQVEQFQKRAVENSERGHRVLITGRPLALAGLERTMPPNLARVAIELMSPKIREAWLQKWGMLAGVKKTAKFREFLEDNRCPEQVRELAREPLLLYLLAAMHRDDSFCANTFDSEDGDELKVRVYQAVLEWVLTKQRAEDGRNLNPKIAGLDEEDLYSLLAEAGLCVVQSGNERASIQLIEDRLMAQGNAGAKELIEAARQASQKNPLKNALAAFYLKTAGGGENSVEFFHKSFGEFLCAERMAETLADWTQKTGRRRKTYAIDEANFNKQVYDLLGYGNLTEEIVGYLRVLLRQNEELDWVVLFERLQEFYQSWCEGAFIELLDASEEMLPLGKARQLQKYGIERGQRQVDIYTGLNVLILLLELHRYGQSQEALKEEMAFYPCGEEDSEEFDNERLLQIIGYSQCLGAWEFGKIVGKFLNRANLNCANLNRANLNRANLSGANLSGADFKGANLSGANLSGADFKGANLSGANLSGADFKGAYLSGADFRGAYLRGAYLRGAYLRGAYLNRANLNRANLRDANLRDANLSGAYLSRADFKGAYLRDANLSGAYLGEVKWDRGTKWANAIGLDEAKNISEELAQQPKFLAAVVLSRGYRFVEEGDIDAALASYQKAQTLDADLKISADFWNHLCWEGCLQNRPADVLFAGENAVQLEPDDRACLDTRCLARGLIGDIAGALEDCQQVLDIGTFDESKAKKQQRQGWRNALQRGENPFTPEELARLRKG